MKGSKSCYGGEVSFRLINNQYLQKATKYGITEKIRTEYKRLRYQTWIGHRLGNLL